jgi:hypothetical protein
VTKTDEVLVELRALMLKKASEQIERHNKAGNPITRSQALRMVIDNHMEMLTRDAKRFEKEGDEEKADLIRELVHYLPELLKEFGLK